MGCPPWGEGGVDRAGASDARRPARCSPAASDHRGAVADAGGRDGAGGASAPSASRGNWRPAPFCEGGMTPSVCTPRRAAAILHAVPFVSLPAASCVVTGAAPSLRVPPESTRLSQETKSWRQGWSCRDSPAGRVAEVSDKVMLPPGQVQVTVVPLPELPKDVLFGSACRQSGIRGKRPGCCPQRARSRGRAKPGARRVGRADEGDRGRHEFLKDLPMTVYLDANCVIYFVEQNANWFGKRTTRSAALHAGRPDYRRERPHPGGVSRRPVQEWKRDGPRELPGVLLRPGHRGIDALPRRSASGRHGFVPPTASASLTPSLRRRHRTQRRPVPHQRREGLSPAVLTLPSKDSETHRFGNETPSEGAIPAAPSPSAAPRQQRRHNQHPRQPVLADGRQQLQPRPPATRPSSPPGRRGRRAGDATASQRLQAHCQALQRSSTRRPARMPTVSPSASRTSRRPVKESRRWTVKTRSACSCSWTASHQPAPPQSPCLPAGKPDGPPRRSQATSPLAQDQPVRAGPRRGPAQKCFCRLPARFD